MKKINISSLNNKHFLSLAGQAVIAGFAIVQSALLYRNMTPAAVGVWVFFLMIYNFGEAIRGGLLGTATIKFYAGTTPEKSAEVLGSVWYLALAITLLLVAIDSISLFFIKFIQMKELVVAIQWFGITFISALPFNLIYWKLTADERYDRMLLLRMVNSGSMIIYIIVLIIIKQMTLEALLLCNVVTNFLTSFVGIFLGYARVRTLFKRTKASVLMLFHFGKYSLGSTAVTRLLSSTDTFFITIFLGPAALAVYSIPGKLLEIVEFPLRSFVATGMSGMANAYNQNNIHQTTYIFKKYSGMLFFAFIPLTIGALLFSDVCIGLMGGGQYRGTEAANLFRLFMILALMYPIDRFAGVTLDIIHKPNLNLIKVIIMLLFAIIGDYTGIIIFKNIYGVAFGTFFTIGSGLVFGYIMLNKYLPVPLNEILKSGLWEMKELFKKLLFKMGK